MINLGRKTHLSLLNHQMSSGKPQLDYAAAIWTVGGAGMCGVGVIRLSLEGGVVIYRSQSSSLSEPLNCDSHINAIKLVRGIPTFCLNSQC